MPRSGTDASFDDLLSRFPKTRIPLPEAHRQRYVQDYQENRSGQSGVSSIVAKLEGWMHRKVAAAGTGSRVLELGAGNLNHIKHESKIGAYDAVEPFTELWSGRPELKSIRRMYGDISEIPEGTRYDRIVSIAVLEHVLDLPVFIARAGLLLDSNGVFANGIPSEGGLAWYLAWRFGTGTAYRLRTGLDYAPLMRHEHVSKAQEIEAVVRHLFREVEVVRFPLPSLHFSLYTVLIARSPIVEECRNLVSREVGSARAGAK